MEVILKYIQLNKIVNRGFLVGPICPIYGCGGIIIEVIVSKYRYNVVIIFLLSLCFCGILEYMVSWLLEIVFHARWWDYSNKKFNINGRICLKNLLFFGLMGCIGVYITNPFLICAFNNANSCLIKNILFLLIFLFSLDLCISVFMINNLKQYLKTLKNDATEEISNKIKTILLKQNFYFRRIVTAYPNFHISIKWLKKIKKTFSFRSRK